VTKIIANDPGWGVISSEFLLAKHVNVDLTSHF
jgi:hypothetical protein